MRTALVTGASTGIGRATARALHAAGFRVYAGARSAADSESLALDGLEPVTLDVTDDGQVAAVTGMMADQGLDALVNNAGVALAAPLEALGEDELRAVLEVNTIGVHRVTRALIPALIRARGTVVTISSISGRIGLPFMGAYSMSKFAIEAWSDVLRRELAPTGVRVVLIEPGAVATPIWEKARREGERPVPERYADDFRTLIRAAANRGDREGVPASDVAALVVEAITADRPKARYALPRRDAIFGRLAPVLPEPFVDRQVAREVARRRRYA